MAATEVIDRCGAMADGAIAYDAMGCGTCGGGAMPSAIANWSGMSVCDICGATSGASGTTGGDGAKGGGWNGVGCGNR